MSKASVKKAQAAAPVAQASPIASTEKAGPVQKYTVAQLRAHCLALFGVTTSTFDAVAKTLEESRYTAGEMKAQIEAWGKAAVKPKKEAK